MDEYTKLLFKLVTYREASGEGNDGMRAVAWVIWNRSKKGWGDLYHVIVGKNQFSSMTILGDPATIRWPLPTDQVWLACGGIVENICSEVDDSDPTNGAVYYYNPQTATSNWFVENIASKKPLLLTLGHHQFYGA